jgi:hypothetical protein
MIAKILISLAETILERFWQSESVKIFVIKMLTKYAKSSDNDVDDFLVSIVKSKLFRI